MTDIFREVEEDVRRERFEKLWKQYGDYIIAGVAAVALLVAGYELWQRYEAQQKLKASAAFSAAQQLADSGDGRAAADAFGKIAKDGGAYGDLARLAQADALLSAGNRSEAIAMYQAMAAKGDTLIANVARIRAAWALVETMPRADIETLLSPLTDPTSPWKYMAHEILAYSDYRAGNLKQALAEYTNLAGQNDAPQNLRIRANAMAALLRAGGDGNIGTVPKPVPPKPAAGDQQKGPAPK